ncbi:ABC transporter substrate-binding protein [Xanthobacteraceae bacterium Astr-EGSB]|uniref:ABC transporter substrate-binding protein n=1 Tax=Astrobacterium formosum TaxID=3069710 RepID=UPI0027AE4DF0|nr:ABC transporter substrate-binding protein [Xanthobacteraceae bacterium Astr-EGSB]
MLNRFSRLSMAAAAAALVLGTAPAGAGGRLSVAQALDPGTWDPIDTFLVDWSKVANNIYDGLIQRGADMRLTPALATSWKVADNGLSIRFELRKGVTFHNGEPFDAQAVKYTFDRLLGTEGGKGPQQSNYNVIERVEVIDDHTVNMVLKKPDPVLLIKLAGYGAMIVPPKYVAEKGDAYFNTHPVGTGPFMLESYEPKVGIKLKANPNFWGGAPKLDGIDFRFIAEPGTEVAELQAGRLDIATLIPLSQIETIKKQANLDVLSVPGPTVVVLRFNTKNGITKDENVRKALIMAVDRDTITKEILLGQAKPIVSFQSEISFGYDPNLKPLPYDPAGAKKLLAAAKVAPGTAVQLDIRGNDSTFREVAQAVAGYLQGVGLKPTVKPYETSVLLNDIIPAGKTGEMFHTQWGGWTFDFDNTAYLMYHTGEKWNPYDSDPKLDALLEKQRSITDQNERLKLLREVGAYVAGRALELPLYNLNTFVGINKRVKGFDLPGDNRYRFLNVTVE